MKSKKFHRSTRQRQVILEELRNLTCHPTASELYEIVREKLPKISLGTVYRNLEFMAESGIIRKLTISGTQARFDGNTEDHHHVRCVECGRVDDLHGLPTDPMSKKFRKLNGYDILGYHLEFFGICPECKNTQHSEKRKKSQK